MIQTKKMLLLAAFAPFFLQECSAAEPGYVTPKDQPIKKMGCPPAPARKIKPVEEKLVISKPLAKLDLEKAAKPCVYGDLFIHFERTLKVPTETNIGKLDAKFKAVEAELGVDELSMKDFHTILFSVKDR